MIVAGFGFRAGATKDSLDAALEAATAERPTVLATAADKADSAAFTAFAAARRLPIFGIEAEDLSAQDTITQSGHSDRARATGSVAEAAALAAAGAGAELLGPRVVSPDGLATCALARKAGR